MKFRIHYRIGFTEDYFDVTGDSIEEIQRKVNGEMDNRALEEEKNNLWSEELK